MGSGDWNDGMNLVGEHGKGESVWLGFFLYEVLTRFADVARGHGDSPFAEHCEWEAARLRQHIEQNGWDGACTAVPISMTARPSVRPITRMPD